MERENSFILRWNDKKDTTVSPACQNPNRKHQVALGLSHSHLRTQRFLSVCLPEWSEEGRNVVGGERKEKTKMKHRPR